MSPVLRIKSNFKGSSLVCSKHYWWVGRDPMRDHIAVKMLP